MRRGLGALITVLVIAGTSVADAQPAECMAESTRPWVALVSDPALGEKDAAKIKLELAADLAAQSIDVCDASRAGQPIARVLLGPGPEGLAVTIRLEVRDAVTSKDLSRTIDTSKIPPDGRALAVAIATGELIRASWVELTMKDAPPPPKPPPPAVLQVARASVAKTNDEPPPARPVSLSVLAAGEGFTSGLLRLGADLRIGVEVGSRLQLGVRAGFRHTPARAFADGSLDVDTIVFGLEPSFAFLSRASRVGFDAFARLDVARLSVHATATQSAIAVSNTFTSVELTGGTRLRYALSPSLGVSIEAGLGGAPVVAIARDGPDVALSTQGLAVVGALGAVGRF